MQNSKYSADNLRRLAETGELMVGRFDRLTRGMDDWDCDKAEVRRLLNYANELRLSADRLKKQARTLAQSNAEQANTTRSILAIAFHDVVDQMDEAAEAAPESEALEPVHFPPGVFSVRELLRFLHSARKTGVVTVATDEETFTLSLGGGELLMAVSDNSPPGLRLGEILVSQGFVTQEVMDGFFARHAEDRSRLGRALESENIVSHEQVAAALRVQMSKLFERLLATHDGNMTFRAEMPESACEPLVMDLGELLCY